MTISCEKREYMKLISRNHSSCKFGQMQLSKLSSNNDKFDKMSFSVNSSIDTHI